MRRFVLLLCVAATIACTPVLVAAATKPAAAAAPTTAPQSRPSTAPAKLVKPGPDSTGPAGKLLEINGDIEITEDHAVLRDVDVRGAIRVRASHVKLLNLRARHIKFHFAPEKDDEDGHSDLLVEDCEVTDPAGGTAVSGARMTVRRTEVHHMGADAFNVGPDTLLEGNYVHHLGMTDDSHADGVAGSSKDGKPVPGVVIRGNHFDMPSHASRGRKHVREKYVGFNSNGVIFLGLFGTAGSPTIVEHNWLNGGNFTVTSGLPGSNIVYRNNRFGRDYNWGIRRTHDKRQRFTAKNWVGNVWDDTGETTDPPMARTTAPSRK